MDLDHEQRLTAVEERSKSNSHRLDEMENQTKVLNRLATNMEVMAEKQKHVAETVDKLDNKVTYLESKPGKKWEAVTEKIIWSVIAAILAFLLGKFGF